MESQVYTTPPHDKIQQALNEKNFDELKLLLDDHQPHNGSERVLHHIYRARISALQDAHAETRACLREAVETVNQLKRVRPPVLHDLVKRLLAEGEPALTRKVLTRIPGGEPNEKTRVINEKVEFGLAHRERFLPTSNSPTNSRAGSIA